MGDTGIRNAGHTVGMHVVLIPSGQHAAAGITHLSTFTPFIGGCGIAIVNPQEGTDLHLLLRRHEHLDALRRNKVNLSRSEFMVIRVTQVQICKIFKGCAVRSLFLSNNKLGYGHFLSRAA